MREKCTIHLLCPVCGLPLTKTRFQTKGKWVTTVRILCENKQCAVDTGEQAHLSAAYEALAVMYYGAEANTEYKRNVSEEGE